MFFFNFMVQKFKLCGIFRTDCMCEKSKAIALVDRDDVSVSVSVSVSQYVFNL